MFKITSIEQDGFFRWTIRPVRVRVVERGCGSACGERAEGIKEESAMGDDGGSGERAEERGDGGCGAGTREERR
jgi:hypothetical protein